MSEEPKLEEPLNPETEKPKQSAEHERLAGRRPLKTVLLLAIGPVLSQLANSVFMLINQLWVARALGDSGLAAISTYNAFDATGRAFGFFLALAAATQISALFGKGKGDEAGQICADLLRLTFACGALVPAVLLPALKEAGRWFGASEDIVELGWDYMVPLCSFTTTTCMYLTVCGFLQGEGRTLLFGFVNLACLILNAGVLDPLFLFGFKMGIRGVSLATIASEIIPGAVVFALYYWCHKFGVKPEFRQFCKCFSRRTWDALKVGVSQLFAQLSVTVPSIVVRKFIGMCVGVDEFSDAMAGFNACLRIYHIVIAVMNGIAMGFVPAGSYSYAAKDYKRYLWLSFHAFWLCCVWGSVACIITYSVPRYLALMFSKTERYLYYATDMIRAINAMAMITGIQFNVQTMLQSMQCGGRATVVVFLNNFGLITIAAIILYYTDKTNGSRIVWCYPIAFAMGIPISAVLLWKPLRDVWRKAKEQNQKSTAEPELEEIKEESKPQDTGVINGGEFVDEGNK